jgi:hypothetical protein
VPGSYLGDDYACKQDLGEDRNDGENRHFEHLHLWSPDTGKVRPPAATSMLQRSNT